MGFTTNKQNYLNALKWLFLYFIYKITKLWNYEVIDLIINFITNYNINIFIICIIWLKPIISLIFYCCFCDLFYFFENNINAFINLQLFNGLVFIHPWWVFLILILIKYFFFMYNKYFFKKKKN